MILISTAWPRLIVIRCNVFWPVLFTISPMCQGSGWGWLGYNAAANKLEIATCANQDPLKATTGLVPLFGRHFLNIPVSIILIDNDFCHITLNTINFLFVCMWKGQKLGNKLLSYEIVFNTAFFNVKELMFGSTPTTCSTRMWGQTMLKPFSR